MWGHHFTDLLTQQFAPAWDNTWGPILDPGSLVWEADRGHTVWEPHPGTARLPPDLDNGQVVAEGSLISEMWHVRVCWGAGYLLVAGVHCHTLNLKCHLLGVNLVKVVLANNHPHVSWICSPTIKETVFTLHSLIVLSFSISWRTWSSGPLWGHEYQKAGIRHTGAGNFHHP